MMAFMAFFALSLGANATVPSVKTPANITQPVLVKSYYRELGGNGLNRCVSWWVKGYSPLASSPWIVYLKYWSTAEVTSVMPAFSVPSLKFFWVIDPTGNIKFRHESSPYWSVPIPLYPYGFNPQNAYAIEVTDPGTTVFVNGLGNVVQGGLVPLLPTTGYSFGSVTFTGVTAAANVWWRPVTPLNVELPK